MDLRLHRHQRHNSNALLAVKQNEEKAEGEISFGLLVWLALLQAPLRLQ